MLLTKNEPIILKRKGFIPRSLNIFRSNSLLFSFTLFGDEVYEHGNADNIYSTQDAADHCGGFFDLYNYALYTRYKPA